MCGVVLPSLGGSSVRVAQLGVWGCFLRCEGGGQQVEAGRCWSWLESTWGLGGA